MGIKLLLKSINKYSLNGYDKRDYGNRHGCPILNIYLDKKPIKITKYRPFYRRKNNGIVYDISTESGHLFAGGILVHNCDDYAFAFTSNMSMIFGINSAGVVSGGDYLWYDKNGIKTGQGRHAFNTIVALNENGELQCYLYEPMKNEWTTYENKVGKMSSSQMNGGMATEYHPSYIMYF